MTPPIEEEKPSADGTKPACTVTDCHFMQCCLPYGHKELHVFTIPPPGEYFEDEEPIEEEKMTDEQEIYEAAQRYRMWPMTDLAGVMEAYKDLLETIRAKQSPQPIGCDVKGCNNRADEHINEMNVCPDHYAEAEATLEAEICGKVCEWCGLHLKSKPEDLIAPPSLSPEMTTALELLREYREDHKRPYDAHECDGDDNCPICGGVLIWFLLLYAFVVFGWANGIKGASNVAKWFPIESKAKATRTHLGAYTIPVKNFSINKAHLIVDRDSACLGEFYCLNVIFGGSGHKFSYEISSPWEHIALFGGQCWRFVVGEMNIANGIFDGIYGNPNFSEFCGTTSIIHGEDRKNTNAVEFFVQLLFDDKQQPSTLRVDNSLSIQKSGLGGFFARFGGYPSEITLFSNGYHRYKQSPDSNPIWPSEYEIRQVPTWRVPLGLFGIVLCLWGIRRGDAQILPIPVYGCGIIGVLLVMSGYVLQMH